MFVLGIEKNEKRYKYRKCYIKIIDIIHYRAAGGDSRLRDEVTARTIGKDSAEFLCDAMRCSAMQRTGAQTLVRHGESSTLSTMLFLSR